MNSSMDAGGSGDAGTSGGGGDGASARGGGGDGGGGVKRRLDGVERAKDVFRRGGPKATRLEGPAAGAGAAGAAASGERDGNDGRGSDGVDGFNNTNQHLAADDNGNATAAAAAAAHPDGSLHAHPRLAAKLRSLCDAWSTPLGAHPNNVSVAVW